MSADQGGPRQVQIAATLMRVGAGFSLLGAVAAPLLLGRSRELVERAFEETGASYTASDVDNAVSVGAVYAVVMGLLAVLLWLVLAHFVTRGRAWARFASTALFVIGLISYGLTLLQAPTLVALLLDGGALLVGAIALIYLWHPAARPWFHPFAGQEARS